MGNCCCPEQQTLNTGGRRPQAFEGAGHRLGSGDEARYSDTAPAAVKPQDDTPEPVVDKNLTDGERAQIRKDRAAAAEARLKKNGGKPKKKKATSSAPLTGPNSEPTMRW